MLFTEGRFFLLFALAFGVHWALRSNATRKLWLLACSCVFYGAWDWRFLGLIFFSVGFDYALGLLLEKDRSARARRWLLTASIVGNLSVLCVFKYFGFFVDSAIELLHWLGFAAHERTLEIVLPVGISFYTFQSMSYTIDVYRRELPATRKITDFALFVMFFPQLVAGPIVRARDFLPQLAVTRLWKDVDVRACLGLFLVGFAKKACLADNIAAAIDAVYARPEAWSAVSHWIALALYHVQIYSDFSGYSDMALATAGLLGYRLTLNFDFPYLATDVSDYWRRWHISLSSWFRDYLYLPLGGNRAGPARTYLNLWIVFFLCGLWHGAQWKYVNWGIMCGVCLIVHRWWRQTPIGRAPSGRLRELAGWALLTWAALMWWAMFRALDVPHAFQQYEILYGFGAGGAREISRGWLAVLAVCLGVHLLTHTGRVQAQLARIPGWQWAIGFGVASAVIAAFTASGYQPFLYFQF